MNITTIATILAIVLTGIAFGEDEFTQHLGKNVTVNVCNMTVYQGNMTEWWNDSIVINELCDPSIGNITIKKSCIVWIKNGFVCD
jgi:hypothetical protein